MATYHKHMINNALVKSIYEGGEYADHLDLFLKMMMENDMEKTGAYLPTSLIPADIHRNLIGNAVIGKNEFKMEEVSGVITRHSRLIVMLSPTCHLYIETRNGGLQAKVNDKYTATISLKYCSAEEVAKWIIRQKKNLDSYMNGWQDALMAASKKIKGNHMALLAIKAIFTDAMREYTNVHYDFIEQKRRLRILVKLPGNKLGVVIDTWWGSYKERLPKQLEDIKRLIDFHSTLGRMDFFVSKR